MVVYICPCYSLSLSYLPSPGSPFLPCKCIHQYHFSRFHIYALIYEIQPVHPKGDQSWVFIGRADAEAETPIHWPPDTKSWLIGKDPDARRDWGQEEKGTTEDEMAGCRHWLDTHEFGSTPGVGDGQGGLKCCDSWGRKESDTTEWLNCTEWCLLFKFIYLY